MSNNVGSLLVELGVNTAAFVEGMDKATYKAKQSAKQIGDAFKGLGNDIGGLFSQFGGMGSIIGNSLAGAGETISKLAGQMGSLNGAAGAAAVGVAGLGAVAIAAAAGLSAMAVQGAELVHSLSMVSQKTGISITSLQGLQAAGSTVGLSLDSMVIGFRKFDQAITGTGRGGGAAAIILKNLGVTARDNEEALNQVADAFSKMDNGPKKAADAIALFGRAGLSLIPLLNKGREGIAEFNRMVEEYGPKIGKDAVKADEDFLVSQAKLGLAWDSFKVDIEKKVLPALTSYITMIADALKSTHNLADEIGSHPWESMKGFASGAANALANKNKPWYEELLGPVASAGEIIGGGLGGVSAAANSHGLSAQDEALKAQEATKKKTLKLADDQAQAEKKIFENIRDGGEAATQLRETKEAIAALTQNGDAADYTTAKALQALIPQMEKEAKLERERRDYQLDPKQTVLGPDKIKELNAELDEEIAKQRDLAGQTDRTTASDIVAVAIADETMKIKKEDRSLANEQSRAEAELARLRTQWGTQAYHDAQQRLQQIKDERKELTQNAGLFKEKASTAAVGKVIVATGGQLNSSLDALDAQRNALIALGAAYGATASEMRAAQITQMTLKETESFDKAKNAYEQWASAHKDAAAETNPFKTALEEEQRELNQVRKAAGDIIDLKLANKLKEERIELQNNADAWEIQANAIGASTEARIQAAEAEARLKARKGGATGPEIDVAGEKARQAAEQAAASALIQKAAAMDLNNTLAQEISDLEKIIKLNQSNSTVVLLARAKEKELAQQTMNEWIRAAKTSGDASQVMAAGLEQLVLDGQNFWGNFEESGITAVQGMEGELAKLVTTGKANFKQVIQGFEEGFIKNGLNAIVSKGATGILNMTGLSGLLPGAGKHDGSSPTAAMYVQVTGGGLGGGLGAAMGALPMPSNNNVVGLPSLIGGGGGIGGLLSGLLGFLPFMAEGGDVTPGKAYVVGEKHPEFFVPDTPGTIHPSLKLGGTQQNVTHVHFHGVTSGDDFKRNESQVSQKISNAVARGNGRR